MGVKPYKYMSEHVARTTRDIVYLIMCQLQIPEVMFLESKRQRRETPQSLSTHA